MALREELQAIYRDYGKLTPKLVVDVARPVDHPLHPLVFDKSVDDAAEAYYLNNARGLIQTVRAQDVHDGHPLSLRDWISVDIGQGPVYEPARKVAVNPLMKKLALQAMEREINQLIERYKNTEGFFEAVEKLTHQERRRATRKRSTRAKR